MQQRKPRADQAHVVVQREPADADIVPRDLDRLANGTHVGKQVCMRQHHAFGVAGGTGGVLQKRDVAALARAASGDVQRQRSRRWGGALSAAAINFSASTTPSSERTRGRSNLATDSARRNVSSMQTSALFMIADCLAAYSSMRSARNGG